MDHRLLLPWILMLVLANLADGALTWDGQPPSQQSPSADLTNANPCQNSIYTFSVDGAEDPLQYSITPNPNPGQFVGSDDKLYCSEATLKTNGYSSYTLTVTITDGHTTLTDTFTVTVIGLPTTTSQTTTASTTQATAASTTQTSTASTTQVTAASTTQTSTAVTTQVTTASTTQTTTLSTNTTVKSANGALKWREPPSERPHSVFLNQTNPCQHPVYTFNVTNYTVDQLEYSITQNPDGKFTMDKDKLRCTEDTLKTNLNTNNISSYTLTVTIRFKTAVSKRSTDDAQPTLVDTFTVTIIGLPSISVCDSKPCEHGGTCAETQEGAYECSCPVRWIGFNCGIDIIPVIVGVIVGVGVILLVVIVSVVVKKNGAQADQKISPQPAVNAEAYPVQTINMQPGVNQWQQQPPFNMQQGSNQWQPQQEPPYDTMATDNDKWQQPPAVDS